MPEMTSAYEWHGRTLLGEDGEKLGTIDEIYFDGHDQPEWARVSTGFLGRSSSLVPLTDAAPQGGAVTVPVTKDQVKDSPEVDADGDLTEKLERQIFEHYGIAYEDEAPAQPDSPPGEGEPSAPEPRDTDSSEAESASEEVPRPAAEDAMTRSEEELHVSKVRRESGRARLRKHVVTEYVQQTVPVRHEEVRVEREPIAEADTGQGSQDRPDDTTAFADDSRELILHEEEVVTEKRVVPKERIRVSKDTVTEERGVSEEIRKERIETEEEGRP